ncbi:ABC transporter permease [Alkaliphilus crotonatoxidans]
MNLKMNTMAFFLISIFTAICVSSISLVTTIEENILLSRISRGDYGKDAIHFSIDQESWSYKNLVDIAQYSNFNDFTLIYDDYEKNLRQIYIKGRSDSPPIITGRYFSSNDFNNGQSVAVIGQNRLQEVIKKNGKQWIKVEDKLFEVIGVMGYHIATLLDDRIIVNADAIFQKGRNNIYILDVYSGNMKYSSLDIYNGLKEMCTVDNLTPIRQIDIDPIGVDRLFKNLISNTIVYALLMISFILCSISISIEWISKQRNKIAVMRLIGWNDRKLKLYIYKHYLFFAILGVGMGLIFITLSDIKITNMISIIIISIINIILGWLITVPPIKKMLKISVTEVMR